MILPVLVALVLALNIHPFALMISTAMTEIMRFGFFINIKIR